MKLDTTEPSFSGAVIARERAEAGHSSSAFLDAALIGIPATAVHVLQPILTPFLGAPEALYFGPEAAWPEIGISGSLRLSEAGRCSTDAYFNAFFLDFWRAHTSLTRLGVVCHAQGALTLRAIVHLANGRREVLAEWHHKGQGAEAPYWLWSRAGEVEGAARIGRLHLEIEAPFGAVIENLAFVTDLAPRNPVTLSIGLCTYEREAAFEQTVAVLHKLVESGEVARVHVVNQGRSFQRPHLIEVLQHPAFSVIEQANLGGAGGFCRAMIEAAASAEAPTHLLMMDDDIELDPRIVQRAHAFAAYTEHDCAIGGQAIELESRTHLQEAGGIIGPNWLTHKLAHDSDLSRPETLALWDQSFVVDYNAWWFCIVPMAAIARCGLPAPVFLHGDDIEYGARLREAGVETVPLPGLGVWHSSFRYKHVGLIHYYDLRNMLINAASHPKLSNLPDPVFVLGWVMHYLLVHRYRAALSSIIAIGDFLAGPEAALGPDSLTRHLRLRAKVETVKPPAAREGVDPAGLTLAPPALADPSMLRQALLYFALFFRILLGLPARRERLLVRGLPLPENTHGQPYLLAMGPHAERCMVMRPNRPRLIALTLSALWVALRYTLGRRAAARRWAGEIDALRNPARWAREFARQRE